MYNGTLEQFFDVVQFTNRGKADIQIENDWHKFKEYQNRKKKLFLALKEID